MEISKSPNLALWFCVAVALLAVVYGAAYGFLRWQAVLIYDVRCWRDPNGISYSQLGVRDNPYGDDTEPWQELLGPPAEKVFFPLCGIETRIWIELRKSGWHVPSLEKAPSSVVCFD